MFAMFKFILAELLNSIFVCCAWPKTPPAYLPEEVIGDVIVDYPINFKMILPCFADDKPISPPILLSPLIG